MFIVSFYYYLKYRFMHYHCLIIITNIIIIQLNLYKLSEFNINNLFYPYRNVYTHPTTLIK